jgi:hypothetical protein
LKTTVSNGPFPGISPYPSDICSILILLVPQRT